MKLMVYEVHSLKEKRQAIKSILGRIQSRYKVSIAEVGLLDSWQTAQIGLACVTNDKSHSNEMISKIVSFIDGDDRVEILDHYIEFINI